MFCKDQIRYMKVLGKPLGPVNNVGSTVSIVIIIVIFTLIKLNYRHWSPDNQFLALNLSNKILSS